MKITETKIKIKDLDKGFNISELVGSDENVMCYDGKLNCRPAYQRNYEKADVFKDKKVWLAVSVWSSSSDVDFICFGQNELIGDFLEDKVTQQIQKSVRRTQSISLSKLLLDYNFKILTINLNREDRYEDLISMSKAFKNYDINNIIELKDYSPEKYLVA